MLLAINDLVKNYGETNVLRNINFSLSAQENVVIEGSSGSGKSTLLYSIGALEEVDQGQILFNGSDITKLSDEKKAFYRNQNIGFIFQFHFLLPSLNCLDNILLPSKLGPKKDKDLKSRVLHYAEVLKISHCLKKYPFEISGGEQQRVNIVRAISQAPDLLLCDEPTGNLDSKNTEIVMELLLKVSNELKASLVVVTHDNDVSSYFQRKITIEDGQIIS